MAHAAGRALTVGRCGRAPPRAHAPNKHHACRALTLTSLGQKAEAASYLKRAANTSYHVNDMHDNLTTQSTTNPLFPVDENQLFTPAKSKIANMKGRYARSACTWVPLSLCVSCALPLLNPRGVDLRLVAPAAARVACDGSHVAMAATLPCGGGAATADPHHASPL